MKQIINRALFALAIISIASNISCSDASNEKLEAFARRFKDSTEGQSFSGHGINGPDRWQLLNTRTALARLAYASGTGSDRQRIDRAWRILGHPSSSVPVTEQVAQLRMRAIEEGLVENLNELLALEELEALDTDNNGYREGFIARGSI